MEDLEKEFKIDKEKAQNAARVLEKIHEARRRINNHYNELRDILVRFARGKDTKIENFVVLHNKTLTRVILQKEEEQDERS